MKSVVWSLERQTPESSGAPGTVISPRHLPSESRTTTRPSALACPRRPVSRVQEVRLRILRVFRRRKCRRLWTYLRVQTSCASAGFLEHSNQIRRRKGNVNLG